MHGYHTACDRVYMLFIVQRAMWTGNNETTELIHMCTCVNACMPEYITGIGTGGQAEENVCHPPPGFESLPMYTHTYTECILSVSAWCKYTSHASCA